MRPAQAGWSVLPDHEALSLSLQGPMAELDSARERRQSLPTW